MSFDPGIWMAALGSALEFDVQRAGYTKPVTLTQIIHAPYGGVVRRQQPVHAVDGVGGAEGLGGRTDSVR